MEVIWSICSEEERNLGTLYFTRHGETIWNVENKICGATDIALTERGHEQAITLGKQLATEKLPIDEILFSPLMRASETARHISEETGISVCATPFRIALAREGVAYVLHQKAMQDILRMEPRLKEQNFGRYESTPRDGQEFRAAAPAKREAFSNWLVRPAAERM